jgi:hypothetical protein
VGRTLIAVGIAAAVVLGLAQAAFAHAGEENVPAFTDVQEAIAVLASQPDLVDDAMDKVHDALDSNDTMGVSLGLLRHAFAALNHDAMDSALVLLERSIGACPGAPVLNPQSPPRSPRPLSSPCPSPGAHLRALNRSPVGGTQEPVFIALGAAIVLAGLVLTRRIR